MKSLACALIFCISLLSTQVFAGDSILCGVIYDSGGGLSITLDEDGEESVELYVSEYADPEISEKLENSVGATECVYVDFDGDSFEVTGF